MNKWIYFIETLVDEKTKKDIIQLGGGLTIESVYKKLKPNQKLKRVQENDKRKIQTFAGNEFARVWT